MIVDDNIKTMILKTSDANELKKYAQAQGMLTLLQDGADKVLNGMTTIEEVYRVAQH
jgi:general secretion pathway protein E